MAPPPPAMRRPVLITAVLLRSANVTLAYLIKHKLSHSNGLVLIRPSMEWGLLCYGALGMGAFWQLGECGRIRYISAEPTTFHHRHSNPLPVVPSVIIAPSAFGRIAAHAQRLEVVRPIASPLADRYDVILAESFL